MWPKIADLKRSSVSVLARVSAWVQLCVKYARELTIQGGPAPDVNVVNTTRRVTDTVLERALIARAMEDEENGHFRGKSQLQNTLFNSLSPRVQMNGKSKDFSEDEGDGVCLSSRLDVDADLALASLVALTLRDMRVFRKAIKLDGERLIASIFRESGRFYFQVYHPESSTAIFSTPIEEAEISRLVAPDSILGPSGVVESPPKSIEELYPLLVGMLRLVKHPAMHASAFSGDSPKTSKLIETKETTLSPTLQTEQTHEVDQVLIDKEEDLTEFRTIVVPDRIELLQNPESDVSQEAGQLKLSNEQDNRPSADVLFFSKYQLRDFELVCERPITRIMRVCMKIAGTPTVATVAKEGDSYLISVYVPTTSDTHTIRVDSMMVDSVLSDTPEHVLPPNSSVSTKATGLIQENRLNMDWEKMFARQLLNRCSFQHRRGSTLKLALRTRGGHGKRVYDGAVRVSGAHLMLTVFDVEGGVRFSLYCPKNCASYEFELTRSQRLELLGATVSQIIESFTSRLSVKQFNGDLEDEGPAGCTVRSGSGMRMILDRTLVREARKVGGVYSIFNISQADAVPPKSSPSTLATHEDAIRESHDLIDMYRITVYIPDQSLEFVIVQPRHIIEEILGESLECERVGQNITTLIHIADLLCWRVAPPLDSSPHVIPLQPWRSNNGHDEEMPIAAKSLKESQDQALVLLNRNKAVIAWARGKNQNRRLKKARTEAEIPKYDIADSKEYSQRDNTKEVAQSKNKHFSERKEDKESTNDETTDKPLSNQIEVDNREWVIKQVYVVRSEYVVVSVYLLPEPSQSTFGASFTKQGMKTTDQNAYQDNSPRSVEPSRLDNPLAWTILLHLYHPQSCRQGAALVARTWKQLLEALGEENWNAIPPWVVRGTQDQIHDIASTTESGENIEIMGNSVNSSKRRPSLRNEFTEQQLNQLTDLTNCIVRNRIVLATAIDESTKELIWDDSIGEQPESSPLAEDCITATQKTKSFFYATYKEYPIVAVSALVPQNVKYKTDLLVGIVQSPVRRETSVLPIDTNLASNTSDATKSRRIPSMVQSGVKLWTGGVKCDHVYYIFSLWNMRNQDLFSIVMRAYIPHKSVITEPLSFKSVDDLIQQLSSTQDDPEEVNRLSEFREWLMCQTTQEKCEISSETKAYFSRLLSRSVQVVNRGVNSYLSLIQSRAIQVVEQKSGYRINAQTPEPAGENADNGNWRTIASRTHRGVMNVWQAQVDTHSTKISNPNMKQIGFFECNIVMNIQMHNQILSKQSSFVAPFEDHGFRIELYHPDTCLTVRQSLNLPTLLHMIRNDMILLHRNFYSELCRYIADRVHICAILYETTAMSIPQSPESAQRQFLWPDISNFLGFEFSFDSQTSHLVRMGLHMESQCTLHPTVQHAEPKKAASLETKKTKPARHRRLPYQSTNSRKDQTGQMLSANSQEKEKTTESSSESSKNSEVYALCSVALANEHIVPIRSPTSDIPYVTLFVHPVHALPCLTINIYMEQIFHVLEYIVQRASSVFVDHENDASSSTNSQSRPNSAMLQDVEDSTLNLPNAELCLLPKIALEDILKILVLCASPFTNSAHGSTREDSQNIIMRVDFSNNNHYRLEAERSTVDVLIKTYKALNPKLRMQSNGDILSYFVCAHQPIIKAKLGHHIRSALCLSCLHGRLLLVPEYSNFFLNTTPVNPSVNTKPTQITAGSKWQIQLVSKIVVRLQTTLTIDKLVNTVGQPAKEVVRILAQSNNLCQVQLKSSTLQLDRAAGKLQFGVMMYGSHLSEEEKEQGILEDLEFVNRKPQESQPKLKRKNSLRRRHSINEEGPVVLSLKKRRESTSQQVASEVAPGTEFVCFIKVVLCEGCTQPNHPTLEATHSALEDLYQLDSIQSSLRVLQPDLLVNVAKDVMEMLTFVTK